MNLTRYNPWLPERLSPFGKFFSDVLGDFFGDVETPAVENFVPAVDVKETDTEYTIAAELPGIKKEDIHIEVRDGVLTLTGERKFEKEDKTDNYTRIERSYGTFRRSFSLPDHVKEDMIEAAYKDGVLTIALPKGEETKPKQIDVKVQ